jgi:recombinational DNA repair protein (RecF pathway)
MAMSLEEFARTPVRDLVPRTKDSHCCDCGTLLQESSTGNHPTETGCLCSDCFYAQIGDLIDRHPLGAPHARRG